MRATVDTSIWVGALLSRAGPSGRVLDALLADRFELVLSAPLLEELGFALNDRGLEAKYGVTWQVAEEFTALVRNHAHLVSVTRAVHGCRDPNDDIVIETAIRGGVVYLVTSDKDLTADEQIRALLAAHGVQVLTAPQFLAELEQQAEAPATDSLANKEPKDAGS